MRRYPYGQTKAESDHHLERIREGSSRLGFDAEPTPQPNWPKLSAVMLDRPDEAASRVIQGER